MTEQYGDMNIISSPTTISVLGLGAMGVAVVRAAAAAGHGVNAWNRTPRTNDDFGLPEHVVLADSPAAAIAAADIVVICVRDHHASRSVIEQIAPEIAGRVVVNLSTGTPSQAAESAARSAGSGIRYVTGAIMVPTSMVGGEQSLVLYAGADEDLATLGPLYNSFGGTSDVVGADHAVPPAFDLAMLDIYFAGMFAHLHATALAGAYNIDPGRFLPYAQSVVETLGASLPGLSSAVEQRTYDGGEARLDMCLAFLEHIVESSREAGIDPGISELVRDASSRAMAHRAAATDWEVVAEDFLVTARSTAP
ncbi:NAD(P)-binding domain-containing protein [Williamsia sp.]|uniref:imine reductase family protein n=1 Tax=Williamsia sp. TaxID=1872085 RepID=UPI002F92C92D